MTNKLTLAFILAFLFSTETSIANLARNINFSHISINQGLSQNTVFDIKQDKMGYMWFATYDGLNRYNGYTFNVYRHNPNNPKTIASDIVRSLYTDSLDRLWIGTRVGLSMYNAEKESFVNYQTKTKGIPNNQINTISTFDSKHLLLATNTGLMLFDWEKEVFSPVPGLENNLFIANSFLHIDDNIWIGLNNGLIIYNKKTKKIIHTIVELNKQIVQSIIKDDDKIFVATEGAGLFMINEKKKTVKIYKYSKNDNKSISSDFIRSLSFDNKGNLWVGTFEGLDIYNKRNDNFTRYTNNPIDNRSLSQNSIRSIYRDKQGGMWCGTYFGGLNYYHSLNNRFEHLKATPYQNTLNDNIVSCIVEDKEHKLWIGTNDKGVNVYDPQTGKFSYYINSQNQDLGTESNNVKTIYVDNSSDLVYIGTHAGGLHIFNQKTKTSKHFHKKNSQLIDNNIYSISKSDEDFLWIGTLKGMMRYYPSNNSFTGESDVLDKILISQVFKDSKKRLWIGSENGLIVYSPKNKKRIGINLIDNNKILNTSFINCIIENSKGEICIGTRSGLLIYSEQDKTLQHYTTNNGLSNNVIYGILEDDLHRLWLSSNKGLVCYTPYSKEFRTYLDVDGIQSNQFNSYSYCKTENGIMYFGGINGITVFEPEKLVDNPYTPSVTIDKILLFNKVVTPDDETGILSKSISQTQAIELKNQQNSFSLEFVVSNYVSGENNTFAYRLKGFDQDWTYTTEGRIVTYTNLNSGTYRFEIKVANNDGLWSNETRVLEITVLPVWWKTWWAILLFSALTIGIAIAITRTVWFRKLLKEELKMEQLDKIRQEESNQMKTRFFINLSHELRTPLTLIESPLHEIISRTGNDKWLQNQLQYIKRNTSKLIFIVNQLMDYRRAELGIFELKVVEGDLTKFVYDIFLLYQNLSRRKKIDFSFDSEITDQKVIFSPKHIELIITNLLSNSFKYTADEGTISLRLKKDGDTIEIEIEDNGKGIPQSLHEKIFDRFYQVNADHTGSGIGLSLAKNLVDLHHGKIQLRSEEGKGSCFKISIPQDKKVYANNEFSENEELGLSKHSQILENTSYETTYTEEMQDEPIESNERPTLLIVEDNLEVNDYLKNELKKNYNIISVNDGIPALDVLKKEQIDLVITDVMLPEMDGIKLCKAVKQNIRMCHIPVVMLSAKAEIDDQIRGLQVGADDYMPKPFVVSVLLSKIQNILRSRRRMQDFYSNTLEIDPEKITFNAMDEELIRKASDIMKKNMDNIVFSADEFSREMAMSRSNLHLKLKAITGESTIEFIRKIRFNEACRLLKDGRYSVSEISVMVGFNSPSYFATSFKKYFGILPTEYVKQHRK